jgi:2-phospho-L-lactate/phosphoenolpyruvate guanylyltransferase
MMSPATWAIVPVKILSEAKRRLAPALGDAARRELVLTMLDDVLGTLRQLQAVDKTVVITADPLVAQRAERWRASVLREATARGLNAAVKDGLAHASLHGVAQALVLPADVPFATAAELARLLEEGTAAPRGVGIVPSADGTGTNALLVAPPDALEPRFGPGSFLEHLSQMVARRVDVQVFHLPGLAADVDEPQDILKLIADERTAKRYAFLRDGLIGAGNDAPRATGADWQ